MTEADFAALEAILAALEAGFAALEAGLTALEAAFAALEAGLTALEAGSFAALEAPAFSRVCDAWRGRRPPLGTDRSRPFESVLLGSDFFDKVGFPIGFVFLERDLPAASDLLLFLPAVIIQFI